MTIRDPRTGARAGAALVALIASPVLQHLRDEPRDGFPLSYYPMFASRRGSRVRLTHLVGVRDDGSRQPLPAKLVAPGGMNQRRKTLIRTVRDGGADALAGRVAADLADRERHRRVVAVEVVTARYRLRDHARPRRPLRPRQVVVHAAAPVPGRDRLGKSA